MKMRYVALIALWLMITLSVQAQDAQTSGTGESATPGQKMSPCEPLPSGNLSDEELKQLVPEGSPGKVRIRWKTESQEDNYGFNIMRSDSAEGTYGKVNSSIVPGEGTTNIPKEYCMEDRSVERGRTYYYFIESISNAGVREVVEGTKGTKVKVKSVEEERAFLRKKALEAAGLATSDGASTETTSTAVDVKK